MGCPFETPRLGGLRLREEPFHEDILPLMADEPLVQQLLNRTKPGEDLHKTLTRAYDRSYEVYKAKAKLPPRGKPKWESNLQVPYAMQVIDTTMVNIVSGKPRATVKPRRPDDVQASRAMQLALDYYVARDHLAEKQVPFTQQGLIYGMTLAKNQWAYREVERPARSFITNADDPYKPLQIDHNEKVILVDGPSFEPWDVYDAWWEPNARDVESAAYFVLRSWLTKDEVLSHARSESNPFGLFENVEELLKTGTQGVPQASAQERLIGGTYEKRKDRFEFLEFWRNDSLTIIGNRQVTMHDGPNPYWHGQKPIVACSLRPDLFHLQGIPESDLVADIQEALWTVQNMRIDNMHGTVHRGITYRESGVLDPNKLVMKPRFKWGVTDHDDVRPFEVQPLPPEAWQEDSKLMQQMQLVSGINPYVSGADMGAVDQNTATGVTALQEVASRLLRFKARQLSYAGYQRTFEQWAGLVKQFLTKPMAVRIEGPDAYDWQTLQPQDIVGDFDIAVEGTEESLSRQQERGEIMGLLNALAPFAQLNMIDFRPIWERVAKAYNFDSPQILFKPEPPPQAPAAPAPGGTSGGMGQQQQQPPPGSPQLQLASQGVGQR